MAVYYANFHRQAEEACLKQEQCYFEAKEGHVEQETAKLEDT